MEDCVVKDVGKQQKAELDGGIYAWRAGLKGCF